MKPYFSDKGIAKTCQCGCGAEVAPSRRYVSGHNFRNFKKSDEQRKKIGDSIRKSWAKEGRRLPIGTKRFNRDGYVVVKVVAGAGRWMPEHILLMEEHVGRKLNKGEIVHHINFIRSDNRIENLYLCKDYSDHQRIHSSADKVFQALLEKGLVRFNTEVGEYEAVLP